MAGKSIANRSAAEADQEERLREMERSQEYSQQPRQQQPAAPPPQGQQAPAAGTVTSSGDRIAKLKELGELRAAGILTEPEFEIEKQRVLTS